MALTVRHLLLLPFELFANTRSCVNYGHFSLFVEGCSMKLADISPSVWAHTSEKQVELGPKSFKMLKLGFLTDTFLTCQEYLRNDGIQQQASPASHHILLPRISHLGQTRKF